MLANLGSGPVPGTCAARLDTSKLVVWIGARHPMRRGWMIANWGLDRCQAPDAALGPTIRGLV
jgi:hypothetical protein